MPWGRGQLCRPQASLVIAFSFGAQYLELLSEHEDLLQLLAQQEIVRKTLMQGLTVRVTSSSLKFVLRP